MGSLGSSVFRAPLRGAGGGGAIDTLTPGLMSLSACLWMIPTCYPPSSEYPRHRQNRENGKKSPCQEKHREFGNFAKTQGILFAQVVNSLMPKVMDTAIFAAEISIFFWKLDRSAKSVLCM